MTPIDDKERDKFYDNNEYQEYDNPVIWVVGVLVLVFVVMAISAFVCLL